MSLWIVYLACYVSPTRYTEYSSTLTLDTAAQETDDTATHTSDTGVASSEEPPVSPDSGESGQDVPNPPGFPSFAAEDLNGEQVRFNFEYTGSVEGGHLVVLAENREFRFKIPDDLDRFDASGGSAIWSLPPCSGGDFFHFSAYVEDRRGVTTSSRDVNLTISGWGETIENAGIDASDDFQEWGDGIRVGNVPKGGRICGDMYGAGHSGPNYSQDIDYVEFRAAETGTYVISLDWQAANSDYDIDIWTQSFEFLGGSFNDGTTAPETFTINLVDGEPYVLRVSGWTGQGGFYQIHMQ